MIVLKRSMTSIVTWCSFSLSLCLASVQAKDRVYITGSMTVLPFAAAVAERFSEKVGHKIPLVEAIGTSGGMRLFCSGNGPGTPDIVMASRRMMRSERHICMRNGVRSVVQIPIGLDGIVFVQAQEALPLDLNLDSLLRALLDEAVDVWADVAPSLPSIPIHILGPSSNTGTYESLMGFLSQIVQRKSGSRGIVSLRHDGAYSEAGDNQNLLIQKVFMNTDVVGIVSFSFFKQNKTRVVAIPIAGVKPNNRTIAKGTYPFSRPLFLYVKKEKALRFLQILAYIEEFRSQDAIGPRGYLTRKGLVPFQYSKSKSSLNKPILK